MADQQSRCFYGWKSHTCRRWSVADTKRSNVQFRLRLFKRCCYCFVTVSSGLVNVIPLGEFRTDHISSVLSKWYCITSSELNVSRAGGRFCRHIASYSTPQRSALRSVRVMHDVALDTWQRQTRGDPTMLSLAIGRYFGFAGRA